MDMSVVTLLETTVVIGSLVYKCSAIFASVYTLPQDASLDIGTVYFSLGMLVIAAPHSYKCKLTL